MQVQKKRKKTAYSLWKEVQTKKLLGKDEKGIHSFAKKWSNLDECEKMVCLILIL